MFFGEKCDKMEDRERREKLLFAEHTLALPSGEGGRAPARSGEAPPNLSSEVPFQSALYCFYSFHYGSINGIAHSPKPIIHIAVGKPEYHNPLLFQIRIPVGIVALPRRFIMLRSIQFNG